jgi:hypothetical protein
MFPLVALLSLWFRTDTFNLGHQYAVLFPVGGLLFYEASLVLATGSGLIPILLMAAGIPVAVCLCILCGVVGNHRIAVVLSVVSAWAIFQLISVMGRDAGNLDHDVQRKYRMLPLLFVALFLAVSFYVEEVHVEILTTASIGQAVVDAVLMLPFLGFTIAGAVTMMIATIVELMGGKEEGRLPTEKATFVFAFSTGLSFAITLLAMFIGHRFQSQALLPQTQRMLWSNALFDGATVATSFYILERAIPPRKAFTIPTAIGLSFLVGLVSACGSLWSGVTNLTLIQVFRVLTAHSVDGRRWELGPYFWTMHTTFLPLLFYLFFVLLCWTGKTFLAFRVWFYRMAKEFDGHELTVSFLRCTGGLLGLPWILWQLAIHFGVLH